MYNQVHPYFLNIEQRIQQLEKQLQQLQDDNKKLTEQLEKLKPLHIDNINYKIQELTVQQLSGTLNIGMTALSDPEEIKKWMSMNDNGENLGNPDVKLGSA